MLKYLLIAILLFEGVQLQAQGNVGIGNTNPQFPLDVVGRLRLRGTGNLANSPGIWFSNQINTFNRALLAMSKPDSGLGIWSQHMNKWAIEIELMREPRLGINTKGLFNSNASGVVRSELHIGHTNFGGSNDGVRIENEGANGNYWNLYTSNTTGAFEFYALGIKRATINPSSGIYTAVSDRRVKRNIAKVPIGMLEKLNQLEVLRYQYAPITGDEGGKLQSNRFHYGFLAQDVEPIFPELVFSGSDNPNQDFLTLNYAGFGVLAIKAIQEQQEQIEDLRKQNQLLEKRLDGLTEMLNRYLVPSATER